MQCSSRQTLSSCCWSWQHLHILGGRREGGGREGRTSEVIKDLHYLVWVRHLVPPYSVKHIDSDRAGNIIGHHLKSGRTWTIKSLGLTFCFPAWSSWIFSVMVTYPCEPHLLFTLNTGKGGPGLITQPGTSSPVLKFFKPYQLAVELVKGKHLIHRPAVVLGLLEFITFSRIAYKQPRRNCGIGVIRRLYLVPGNHPLTGRGVLPCSIIFAVIRCVDAVSVFFETRSCNTLGGFNEKKVRFSLTAIWLWK